MNTFKLVRQLRAGSSQSFLLSSRPSTTCYRALSSTKTTDENSLPSTIKTSEPIRFEADILNGVPAEVTQRTVRIYRPAKTAMQSGKANSQMWKLDFDVKERWENPLMGWASSADTVQALRMTFKTKEDAILFAERQGYEFWVEEPKEPVFQVKSYSENFKYVPGKLRHMRTK